jgi:hypothetical protein
MLAGFRATFSIPLSAPGVHFCPLWHGAAVLLDRFSVSITSTPPCPAELDAPKPSQSVRTGMAGLALDATRENTLIRLIDTRAGAAPRPVKMRLKIKEAVACFIVYAGCGSSRRLPTSQHSRRVTDAHGERHVSGGFPQVFYRYDRRMSSRLHLCYSGPQEEKAGCKS